LAEVLHVCGPSRVFFDVHAAGKNEQEFFQPLRRLKYCETALAVAFCAALRAVARSASQCDGFLKSANAPVNSQTARL
jgi:hypothetical protein